MGLALGRLAGFVVAAAAVVAVRARGSAAVPHPMLDVRLFANLRFSAASTSVTVAFFSLFGFIFLITQYFQQLRDYGPLSTGVRILPVAVQHRRLVGGRLPAGRANRQQGRGRLVACCPSAASLRLDWTVRRRWSAIT